MKESRTRIPLVRPSVVLPLSQGIIVDGIIHNPFPETNIDRDVRDGTLRAYYFPVIDAMYLPIKTIAQQKEPEFSSAARHEEVHAMVADSLAVCAQREMSFSLLDAVVDFVAKASEDWRLLIPSFKAVGPHGLTIDTL